MKFDLIDSSFFLFIDHLQIGDSLRKKKKGALSFRSFFSSFHDCAAFTSNIREEKKSFFCIYKKKNNTLQRKSKASRPFCRFFSPLPQFGLFFEYGGVRHQSSSSERKQDSNINIAASRQRCLPKTLQWRMIAAASSMRSACSTSRTPTHTPQWVTRKLRRRPT